MTPVTIEQIRDAVEDVAMYENDAAAYHAMKLIAQWWEHQEATVHTDTWLRTKRKEDQAEVRALMEKLP